MAAAPPEAKVVELSNATISYRDIGSGPVVLAIHGGGPGATGWGNFRLNVPGMPGFRFLVPDLPGFGESRYTRDDGVMYHMSAARVLSEFLDKIGVKKAHLIGNSMGGGVSLCMAWHKPEQIDRMVLMGPWIPGFVHHLFGPGPASGGLMGRYFTPEPSLDKMRELVQAFVYDWKKLPDVENLIKSRYEVTLKPGVREGFARMIQGTPIQDPRSMWDRVASIQNKTLLFWGKEDKFSALEDSFQYLAAMPNAELVILKQCGHWAMLERPDEFNAYVSAFYNRKDAD